MLSAVNATGGSTSMVRIDEGSTEGVKASAPPVSAATPAAKTARPETFMAIPTYRSINPPTMNLPAYQSILRISPVTGRRVADRSVTRAVRFVELILGRPGSR
ncbi:acriflavin resistance protein [Mycobacterium sp. PO1]|nr:acriflavin resistance protein [Mycobacterium sp. PO1]GFM21906.1 acriflavin resistance protein [Mycobacterium sp. PO2]